MTRYSLYAYGTAALLCMSSMLYVLLLYYPIPTHDHFAFIPMLLSYMDGTLPWHAINAVWGGHWYQLSLALMLPVAEWSNWNMLYEVTASLCFGLIAIGLLWYRLQRLEQPHSFTLWMLPVACFIILSLDQAGNWLWGWQLAAFMTATGIAGVVCALSGSTLSWKHATFAMLMAALAVYNFSTGLITLPVGAFMIALHRATLTRKTSTLIIWALFSALLIWHFYTEVYLHSNRSPSQPLNLTELWRILTFCLYYLGAPVSRFAEDLAPTFTIIGAGVLFFTLQRSGYRSPLGRFILGMASASIGAAGMTAIARAEFGIDQALVSRYITFSNFYWIAVFTALFSCITTAQTRTLWLYALACILLLMKAGNAAQVATKHVRISHDYHQIASQLVQEDYDPTLLQPIYFDTNSGKRLIDQLKTHELTVFAR